MCSPLRRPPDHFSIPASYPRETNEASEAAAPPQQLQASRWTPTISEIMDSVLEGGHLFAIYCMIKSMGEALERLQWQVAHRTIFSEVNGAGAQLGDLLFADPTSYFPIRM